MGTVPPFPTLRHVTQACELINLLAESNAIEKPCTSKTLKDVLPRKPCSLTVDHKGVFTNAKEGSIADAHNFAGLGEGNVNA